MKMVSVSARLRLIKLYLFVLLAVVLSTLAGRLVKLDVAKKLTLDRQKYKFGRGKEAKDWTGKEAKDGQAK